jgi:endonuclease G
VLFRDGFVLSNNRRTKFSDWAAYRVTQETMGKSKRGRWKVDPDLAEHETLEPEDFRGAHAELGTDRGHQVPLASFSGTEGREALNYMSNLTPQRSLLNQKLWNFLESAVRDLASGEGVKGVYVVTGPLFEREMPPLPHADEPHRVPSGYFKVVALVQAGLPTVAAFIVDQETSGSDSYCDHRTTVDEVERRAGWDLFVGLEDQIERRIEGSPGNLYERLGCSTADR